MDPSISVGWEAWREAKTLGEVINVTQFTHRHFAALRQVMAVTASIGWADSKIGCLFPRWVIHVGLMRPTGPWHVRCTSDSSRNCALQRFDEKAE